MQRFTPRDIVVLGLIAALFVWSFARSSSRSLEEFAFFLVALVLAVSFHECAHAVVALGLGDSTAKLLGRVSLNPIRHLVLFGFLAVVALRLIVGAMGSPDPYLLEFFRELIMINIALAAFNFLPIPPL